MTDISVSSTVYQAEKRSWYLGTPQQPGFTVSGTLDVSAFTAGTHYPNGYIPSGMPLGRITASGLYGPYGASPSEVQTVGLGAATAGTVTITFDGATTAAIAFNASAAAIQAALEATSTINPGDVTVTGGPFPGVVTLTFGGRYLGQNVPEVTVTPSGLTGGTVTVATTTQGGGSVTDGRETAAGLLFSSVAVPTAGTDVGGAVLVAFAPVIASKLPVALDAAGQADLKSLYFVPTGA